MTVAVKKTLVMYRGVYIRCFRIPRIYSLFLEIQNTYEALKVMHTKFSNLAKRLIIYLLDS